MKKNCLFAVAIILCISIFTVCTFAAEFFASVDESTILDVSTFDYFMLSEYGSDLPEVTCTLSTPWHYVSGNEYATIVSFKIYHDGLEPAVLLTFDDASFDVLMGYSTGELTTIAGPCSFETPDGAFSSSELQTFLYEFFGVELFSFAGSGSDSSVIGNIFSTFSSVFAWIGSALITIASLFWANGSLSFFGLLALVALSISIFFLLVRVISNFLHFKS